MAEEDANLILEIIFKIYEKNFSGSHFQKSEFNSYSEKRIFEFLLQICNNREISTRFKDKMIHFLDNQIPNWQIKEKNRFENKYNYQDIPVLVEKTLNHSKKGIDFLFKKHDFTKCHEKLTEYTRPYYNYIEEFVDKDFKNNFPIVIKNLSEQFQSLYISYGYKSDFYNGYEVMGGYSSFGNNYDLDVLLLESVLYRSINKFYEKTKDWEYLHSFILSEYNKDNPVFVKRSFIPFLLKRLKESSEENPEENKFYGALKDILKIKEGFPSTENVLVNELSHIHSDIKDDYLEKLVKMSLYKYSKEDINYDIFMIQFLFLLIENGKTNFKIYFKKILLNKNFKKHYIYDQVLRLFESRMVNQNINEFFNEIKDELDITKNNDLIYRSIILDLQTSSLKKSKLFKLFKSSSETDLNCLASIISKDLWNTSGSKLLKQVFRNYEKSFRFKRIL